MHLDLSVFIVVVPPHRREDRARPALRLHHRDGREREPRYRGLLSAPAQVGDTLAQPGDRCEIRDLLTIKYQAHVSPDVTPYQFSPDKHYLSSIVLEVDFFNKKNTTTDPFNSDDMAKEFSMQFCKQAFTVGMQCVFNFADKKLLSINIKVKAIGRNDNI